MRLYISLSHDEKIIINSFQCYAVKKFAEACLIDRLCLTGNWVMVDGESIMTFDGVDEFLRSQA